MPAASANSRKLFAAAALLGLVPLLAWDASGLDSVLASWSASASGFPLRDNWWLTVVLHDGARRLAWAAMLALSLGVWWPFGPLRRLTQAQRLQLAASTLLAAALVSLLKSVNAASCPWAMAEFGGVARHRSHWATFFVTDGGGGHCFPAGHASSGFAFVSGWFAFRRQAQRLAWAWLGVALAAGAVLGIAQQLRGAHFMSHTLWTLWVCWGTAWLVDALVRWRAARMP